MSVTKCHSPGFHTSYRGLENNPERIIEEHRVVVLSVPEDMFGFDHNFPCPVCRQHKAMMASGFFHPCDSCREKGYHVINIMTSKPWWVPVSLWKLIFKDFGWKVRDSLPSICFQNKK